METERYVIVKIGRPTTADIREFDAKMGVEKFETETHHGLKETGEPFKGVLTVAVCGNAYALDLVIRSLRAGCVPYSLEEGKPVARRKKKCTSSMQSELIQVSLTLEVQTDLAQDLANIMQENAEPLPEELG